MYLCGGLCIDARSYRRVDQSSRDRIAAAGGIAEILLRECFADLTDRDVIFGHCGDAKAKRVTLRAGFETTQHQYLIVHWKRDLTHERRQALIAVADAIGPF